MVESAEYNLLRKAIESNQVDNFEEITAIFKKWNIYQVTGANHRRIEKCVQSPWLFTFQELAMIAEAIDVDEAKFLALISKLRKKNGKQRQARRSSKPTKKSKQSS